MRVAAVIPAAGRGRRLKSRTPKAFLSVAGRPLVMHTLANLKRAYPFRQIIVAAEPSEVARFRRLVARYGLNGVTVVAGGKTRAQSVRNAVLAVARENDWVLVHDAARPLVDGRLVRETLNAARRTGAALCALPATATVKKSDGRGAVLDTEDRRRLFLAQTPQAFRKKLLLGRYRAMGRRAFAATDEAALFDRTRVGVRIAPGQVRNIKITTPEDLKLLRFYLSSRS